MPKAALPRHPGNKNKNIKPVTAAVLEHLARCDARLASVISLVGKYEIRKKNDPFRALVESIIYQQLAGSAADAICTRFIKIFGKFPSPSDVLSVDEGALRRAGLSGKKVCYIRGLCAEVSEGRLDLSLLGSMSDLEIVAQLTKLKGIGTWTAEMFLIFCLGRQDVLPVGDLGLKKALQKVYSLSSLPTATQITNIAQPWRPYRSVATWYLWKSLDKFKAIG